MSGRGRVLLALGAVVAIAVAWAPVIVAHHYADGPGGAEVNRARVDQGWKFVADAVRESRGALLGDDAAALAHAQRIWARPSGRATSVRLVYFDGPFTVPVPPGGTAPGEARRAAAPPGAFGWVVRGHVRGGPRQMIGLLDYSSGAVVWDIRPRLRSGSR
jgi:hypothetical protein